MEQNNLDFEEIRDLLSTLNTKVAMKREKYEKALTTFGENHPSTVAARKEFDDLLANLKNFLYWLDDPN